MRSTHLFPLCSAALSMIAAGCTQVQESSVPVAKASPADGASDAANAQFMSPSGLADKADVPLYPGADTPEGASTVQHSDKGTRYEIVESTTDQPASVLKYYEAKLQHADRGASSIMGVTPKGNYVIIKTSRTGGRTNIDVVSTVETATEAGGSKP